MRPVRLSPVAFTLGLLGMGENHAYPRGKSEPKVGQQRPANLDPAAVAASLGARDPALAARVRQLAEPEPAVARRPRQVLRAFAAAGRKVAKPFGQCFGVVRAQPRELDRLLRYHGTAAGSPRPPPAGGPQLVDPMVDALRADELRHRAQVALHEALGVRTVLDAQIERAGAKQELELREQADRAFELLTRAEALSQTLSRPFDKALERSRKLAVRAHALRDEHDALEDGAQQLRAQLMRSDVDLADIRRLRARLHDVQVRLDRTARQLEEIVPLSRHAAAELERLAPSPSLQQHTDHVDRLRAAHAELEARATQAAQARTRLLVPELAIEKERAALESLRRPLDDAIDRRQPAQRDAEARAAASRTGQRQADDAALAHVLATLPGFEPGPRTGALRVAMQQWSSRLPAHLAQAFAGQALRPPSAVAIGMQALAIAAEGDAGRGITLVRELRQLTLRTLLPAPDEEPSPASAAAQRLAQSLARVPRGMQVLTGLLAPGGDVLHKAHLEAARLHLRIDAALRETPIEAASVHAWLRSAQRAARGAVHADDPALAIEAAAPAERAAYRAVRNGYETNAPGSPYDRANQHLQKIADWLHGLPMPDHHVTTIVEAGRTNPLHALPQALTVGSATLLPTPARRAAGKLTEAAAHLLDIIDARRDQRRPGTQPSPSELGLRALAETVLADDKPSALAEMKLDGEVLRRIRSRQAALVASFGRQVAASPASSRAEAVDDEAWRAALANIWQDLSTAPRTMADALHLLSARLLDDPRLRDAASPDAAVASTSAAAPANAREDFAAAVDDARRLLREGDPKSLRSGADLFELCRDMIEQMGWRDRLRMSGQRTKGLNAAPLTASMSVAGLMTGLGLKLVLSGQRNVDRSLEFYMGRTGMYVQIGQQATGQFQAGAGASIGQGWGLDSKKATATLGVAGDWRMRYERGTEQGIQLRIPRTGGGRELELRAQFLDMFEHLLHIASPGADGQPARRDWMQELLTHHATLNVGLIEGAPRRSLGSEINLTGTAGLKLGQVAGHGRRVGANAVVAGRSRQDHSGTRTQVAGHMNSLYLDATATHRVEVATTATAGIQLWEATRRDGEPRQKGAISLGVLDAGRTKELHSSGRTHFCTLFTFGGEIDPVRSDRARDFLDAASFEKEVRRDWAEWVHYGTAGLPATMPAAERHAVAERRLEHFMAQAHAFAKHNKFAAMFVDRVLKAETAPLLDGLRAQAQLWREAGRDDLARDCERSFDDLISDPAIWEPTLLLLREKTKLQVDRGVDLLIKRQANRIGESQRTVAQWPPYVPVPQPAHGDAAPQPARRWAAPAVAITPQPGASRS